jgi:hypothetical protein
MIKGISVFKCENDPSILLASKVVWDEGVMPHRVVLRKNWDEYITHMENLIFVNDGFVHSDFYWGHYFQNDLEKANADYLERVQKL